MSKIIDKVKDAVHSNSSNSNANDPVPHKPAKADLDSSIKSDSALSASASTMSYAGKCHCGHHEWEVELNKEQSNHILCHCDTCKILGGGAFTMNQIIPKNQLKITKGGEPSKYTYYGDSGKAVNCYYCPKCTTHIYHHQEVMGPDTIIARTALLAEGRKNFEVGAEIYGKDKMKWEKEIGTTFDVLPPS